jgi:energy-coupling factor transporter transmembrane protein EcfT
MQTDANVMPGASGRRVAADPRALLAGVALVVAASIVTVRASAGMLALFAFTVLWHTVVAGPAPTLRLVLRALPLALLVVAVNAVLVAGAPLWSIRGHRVVSVEGLGDGVFFALRLGVMLLAVSVLVAGSRAEDTAHGIHDIVRRVSRPAAERMALFAFLAAGFVPLFVDEIARVRTAQAFRAGGADRGLRQAAAVHVWLVPVLMSAARRSGQLALAVELREIRSRLVPSLPPLRMRRADVVWTALVIAVVVLASWSLR